MADSSDLTDDSSPGRRRARRPRRRCSQREPLVLNNRSYSWITNRICGIIENPQPKIWWLLFIPACPAVPGDGVSASAT